MWIFVVVLLGFLYTATAFRLRAVTRPAGQLRLLDTFAREADLSPDPVTGPRVQAQLVRRERVVAIGIAVFFTICLAVALQIDAREGAASSSTLPLAAMGPIFTGLAARPVILTGLLLFDAVHRPGPHGPRVARIMLPRVTDYVRPAEVWISRAMAGVVLPVSALIVGLAQRHRSDQPYLSTVGLWATAVAGWLLLVIVEVTTHRMVGLGQPAGSPVELAWGDAMRAAQLRELYLVLTFFCLTIAFFTASVLKTNYLGLYGVLVVVIVLSCVGKPGSYYRRRLWPWPTDGETA